MRSIAVIGAGITGVTTAFELHRLGLDVTVYDRQRYAAMETSFANGGQLSASNAEVWNQTSTVLKGLKWMWKRDAPLLVSLKPSWHKASWMAEFIRAIPQYRDNTVRTTRMAIAARDGLREMAQVAGVDFDLSPAGILHFYAQQHDFDHAREVTKLLAQGGLARKELMPEEVRAHCPELSGDLVGGFWTESDMTGDIHKFTMGVAGWLRGQGVQFKMGTPVEQLTRKDGGIDVDGTHHDAVVICAGVASRRFAAQLGERVNIYPVKGYSITVNLTDEASRAAAPTVSLLDDAAKIVTSRLGEGRFRIAGTAEFNGENRDIRDDRIRPLVKWCERYFPGVCTESVVPWAGLRPMMPNMMPRVGAGQSAGVYFNTGHGHLGWTLSAATARILAGEVAGTVTPALSRAA
ncbi:D-amino acid dehydrogenase [Sulfitobacter albidus]|uniref:D-amino acid dehydrogenase n=1 Tax=Sulfitobacter albidus TaxID=2829501 RepID=A0A975JDY7_9RHOB|nr:D-amino acid dehydrogenase [Sulfitobacter albidus]QUJ76732.1 D-amino acid dehydrogenase [Sulfitobacter albidus]